jgi:hypothetical protein
MPCKTKKELFMSNSHSKQAFINMLCEKLNEHDTRYKNAVDDVTNDKYPPQESLLFVECSIF